MIRVLLLICGVAALGSAVKDAPYSQVAVERFAYDGDSGMPAQWPRLPMKQVHQVVTGQCGASFGVFFVTASSGVVFRDEATNTTRRIVELEADASTRLATASALLVMANSTGITQLACTSTAGVCSCSSLRYDPLELEHVHDACISTATAQVWVGATRGLFNVALTSAAPHMRLVQHNISLPVHAVACSPFDGSIAAGTAAVLWRYDPVRLSWRFERVLAQLDAPATALVFDSEKSLWIGNAVCASVQRDTPRVFSRVSGVAGNPGSLHGGLPSNNITAIDASAHGEWVFLGSRRGLARYSVVTKEWHYHYGMRWMGGERVSSVAATRGGDGAWVATERGVSLVRVHKWTLADKAAHYNAMLPRHNRMGLCSYAALKRYGDPSSWTGNVDESDGLWTGFCLAAESLRYASTGAEDARTNAWAFFEGMERLYTVTGIPGLTARTFAPASEKQYGSWWHNSTTLPALQWQGDTSSDSLAGHMMAYPLFHDLVCRNDTERSRPLKLVNDTLTYIIANGFYLIDVTGRPTRWGIWAPEKLNADPFYYDERGLNSLEILSFLAMGHRLTGNTQFKVAFDFLWDQNEYGTNALNQKINTANDDNFSDDELAYMCFVIYFASANGSQWHRSTFEHSLRQQFAVNRHQQSSLWNVIACLAFGAADRDCLMADALADLRNAPLELVDFLMPSDHRLDVQINAEALHNGKRQSLYAIKQDERTVHRWNANPFQLDTGSVLSGGTREFDPGTWLMPYWLARHQKLIE